MIKTIDLNYHYQKGISLAIGFFDGLHLGHQELLKEARNSSAIPSILTFEEEWKMKLKGGDENLLLTEKEKDEKLKSNSIQNIFLLPFSEKILHASKEEFLQLLRNLSVQKIVVGEDFTFAQGGKGKAKDLLLLKEEGIEVKILPLLYLNQEKISTTNIKKKLEENKIEGANQMLGYPFFYQGKVIHGYENGRKIGFKTANIEKEEKKFKLKEGVYQTKTTVDGKTYLSMTNIGKHPTVEPLRKDIIETNIFDYDDDCYGKEIKVEFFSFLREQKKFASLEELKEQLIQDKKDCYKK